MSLQWGPFGALVAAYLLVWSTGAVDWVGLKCLPVRLSAQAVTEAGARVLQSKLKGAAAACSGHVLGLGSPSGEFLL